jgi:hypothetical protein
LRWVFRGIRIGSAVFDGSLPAWKPFQRDALAAKLNL